MNLKTLYELKEVLDFYALTLTFNWYGFYSSIKYSDEKEVEEDRE